MFFCIKDLQDGRKTGINAKGREPLAYKVQNQKTFRKSINELMKMIDDGKFEQEPVSWNLYRKINGLEIDFKSYGNNIFETKGDYIAIDDYSTDIDNIKDIEKMERIINIVKGVENMIKVRATDDFHLARFNELKNIKRLNGAKKQNGMVYTGDIFECPEDLAKYLSNEIPNPVGKKFIEVIEVIPEEVKEEKKEPEIIETIETSIGKIGYGKVEVKELKQEKKPAKKTTTKKTTTKRKTTRKSIAKK